jgi:hypothetical protein
VEGCFLWSVTREGRFENTNGPENSALWSVSGRVGSEALTALVAARRFNTDRAGGRIPLQI